MSKNVKEISGEQLEELIAAGKTVVCDFWAAWCGPCRMLAPVLDTLAEEFASKAEFVKVNVDESGEAAIKYNIMSIPNVLVFEKGAVKANSLGFVPEEQLRAFLKQNL